jgi:hypothetical protein
VTVAFTYTGTTSGLDSVAWSFGDGATSTAANPVHSYTASGTYSACVTIYTDCGSATQCNNIVVAIPSGVAAHSLQDAAVYPNPASNEITIVGVTRRANYRLLNISGISVQQGYLEPGINTLNLDGLIPGIYILERSAETGERSMTQIVKIQ